MFFVSAAGPITEEEEVSSYPGCRDRADSSAEERRLDQSTEERDGRMEERQTKVLHILSKLQDDSPGQPNSKGRSNFEDCEFIIQRKKKIEK